MPKDYAPKPYKVMLANAKSDEFRNRISKLAAETFDKTVAQEWFNGTNSVPNRICVWCNTLIPWMSGETIPGPEHGPVGVLCYKCSQED